MGTNPGDSPSVSVRIWRSGRYAKGNSDHGGRGPCSGCLSHDAALLGARDVPGRHRLQPLRPFLDL